MLAHGEGGESEEGGHRYKLPVLRSVSTMDVMYSMGTTVTSAV